MSPSGFLLYCTIMNMNINTANGAANKRAGTSNVCTSLHQGLVVSFLAFSPSSSASAQPRIEPLSQSHIIKNVIVNTSLLFPMPRRIGVVVVVTSDMMTHGPPCHPLMCMNMLSEREMLWFRGTHPGLNTCEINAMMSASTAHTRYRGFRSFGPIVHAHPSAPCHIVDLPLGLTPPTALVTLMTVHDQLMKSNVFHHLPLCAIMLIHHFETVMGP